VLSYKLYHTSGQVLHGIDIWSWGGLCVAVGRSAGYPNQEIAVKFAWMEPQKAPRFELSVGQTLALFIEDRPELVAIGVPKLSIGTQRAPQPEIRCPVVHDSGSALAGREMQRRRLKQQNIHDAGEPLSHYDSLRNAKLTSVHSARRSLSGRGMLYASSREINVRREIPNSRAARV
jgi:hypothetical protein